MADVALTCPISYESTKRTNARMLSVQFGDGYAQDAPDGINSTPEEWQVVTPPMTSSQIDTIESTLISAMGVRLLWTAPTPGATQKAYRVPAGWTRTFHSYNVESLSFTLREAFG